MPRVLVVDDQPDIRDLLVMVLSAQSFEVTTASGGREALERLQEGLSPDVILLDVQMPEMDGWNVLSLIRNTYGVVGPRVVMCTVKGHPKDLIHGWTLGCDGYVWKPIDLKALVGEIWSVLGRSEADRQRVRRTAVGEAQMLLRSLS